MASRKTNISNSMIEVLSDLNTEYFLNTNEESYVTTTYNHFCRTFKVQSKTFKSFLQQLLKDKGMIVKISDIANGIEDIEAHCQLSNVTKHVFNRIGYDERGSIIIDLANNKNEYVIIDKNSYNIVNNIKTPIVRHHLNSELPQPVECDLNASIDLIKKYLNLKRNDDLYLVLAFILKTFIINVKSCVILVFQGKQDSGKSIASELIKYIIDPSTPLLSSPPKNTEDLVITLNSCYLPAFDNLSGINNELSDFLCSLVYGVSYTKRTLYTDDDMKRYFNLRDLIFNGIEELSNRDDLNDRLIEIELESIDPKIRKDKTTLNKEMEIDRPKILHGLYLLLSITLKNLEHTRVTNLPRMSDYARIGMAMFESLKMNPDKFIEIYQSNLNEKRYNSFWNDPLCSTIFDSLKNSLERSMDRDGNFTVPTLTGTSMELLEKIFKKDSKTYKPKSPRGFSVYLKRIEGMLKGQGIIYKQSRSSTRREITIEFDQDTLKKISFEIHQQKKKEAPFRY